MRRPWDRFDFFGADGEYERVWAFQKSRIEEIANGSASEALIFCEHEPVITKGRRSHSKNVLDPQGHRVVEIERGGDVTWHGPGQLVAYPLFRLNGEWMRGGLHEHLRFCEEAIIRVLNEFSLDAGRYGPTGVWIRRGATTVKKIASIGISVRRWVTYHGMAINVSNALQEFERIRPCNFDSNVMTSLAEEGIQITLLDFADKLEESMISLVNEATSKAQVNENAGSAARAAQ